jgi:hypothetical protein
MRFEFKETQPNGGGQLTVIAENSKEVVKLAEHFRMFDKNKPDELLALAAAIVAGTLTYISKPNAKRPWFRIEESLDRAFVEPYMKLLERHTGYKGETPELELTDNHPRRLCHTHITDTCELTGGLIHFIGYEQAEEWNNKPAEANAHDNMLDYVAEDFGERKHEPEYIDSGCGCMKPNPSYLRRHKATPASKCEWFWDILFQWWLNTRANAKQKDVIAKALGYSNKLELNKPWKLNNYSIYSFDQAGTCKWDEKGTMARVYTWEQFAALK